MSVAPPSQGLGSNFNYFLADGGNAITGLNVEITFAEPLISTSNGFGFQLNGYAQELSGAPSTTPNWQQYVVFSQPGDRTLYGIIDNWEGTVPDGTYAQIINDESTITTLPKANQIPAGASINIVPTFNSKNVITGVTYVYTPPGGQAVSTSVTLTDLDVYGTSHRITSAYESPISALTLNIVGDYDGNDGVFSSGSGTIVYTAAQPLTVLTTEPSYTAFQDGTGETANTVYGELPVSDSTTITQTWGISAEGSPFIGPAVGHKLPIPPSARQKKKGQN
ncbi:hypothetical protein TASIC1_0017005300 [Trichoderma asperellum]|uniref:Uncharacterized protein n=1 Tax=Trichoderma asperellum TaxID=101201 RepID=A0A6V8R5E8_TRIAP|nr:hypothetical protein LI328DRAFT_145267 [Trichoderma asperelloides]GFP60291.1 hypothetical protein TASIC1_0017005300 [Trichoderma asperellum]